MEIKKEELYEFEIESHMPEDPEPIDDPLSASIKTEFDELSETNDSIELADETSRFNKIEQHNYSSSDNEANLVSDNNNDVLQSHIPSWRQRKHDIELLEESKAKRLRQRIRTIKSRLIAKLELPDSELEARRKRDVKLNVLRRNKRLAQQTPEEIADRKVLQAEQQRWVRICLEATESAEETARRKIKQSEKKRNYRAMRLANETEKDRKARKERERRDHERFKQRKLEKSRHLAAMQSNTSASTAHRYV